MTNLKESKLPKGLKWTDNCVITRQEKNLVNPIIQFYPYGDDLYIKGLYLIYSNDKDGKYHYCTNYDNCTDDSSTFTEYKHKDNYIYQADSDGNWTILLYVVDDGLFAKEYTKSQE